MSSNFRQQRNLSSNPYVSEKDISQLSNTLNNISMDKSLMNTTNPFFFKSQTRVKSPERHFSKNFQNEAINMLIYGVKVHILHKNTIKKPCIFSISEDLRYLQWISTNKKPIDSRLNLKNILLIDEKLENFLTKNSKKISSTGSFLSISYITDAEKKRNLTLVFSNFSEKNGFWQGLLYFMSQISQKSKDRSQLDMMASQLIVNSHEKLLDIKSLQRFLKEKKISLSQQEILGILQRNGVNSDDLLKVDKNMVKTILKEVYKVKEIVEVFTKYCKTWIDCERNSDSFMKLKELKKFFVVEQNQILCDNGLRNIIRTFDKEEGLNKPKEEEDTLISLAGFQNILLSDNNQIFDVSKFKDMNKPLTDYYIKCSHNTYLTSNQIIGNSSVESYIQALSQGYRCIELDCWDGDQGEPIIYHGYTLTTKIRVKDVIVAINDYGFIKNPYPIILSIENHCCPLQQKIMASYFVEIFKEKLYILPENHEEYEFFPSPNELKNKILVKTKVQLCEQSKKTPERRSVFSFNFRKNSEIKLKNIGSNNNTTESHEIKTNTNGSSVAMNFDSTEIDDNIEELVSQKNKNIYNAKQAGVLGANSNISVKSVCFLQRKPVNNNNIIVNSNNNNESSVLLLMNQSNGNEHSSGEHIINLYDSNELFASKDGLSPKNFNVFSEDSIDKQQFLMVMAHSENIIRPVQPPEEISLNKNQENTDNITRNFSKNKLETKKTIHHSVDLTNKVSVATNTTKKINIFSPNFHYFDKTIDITKTHSDFYKCLSLLGLKIELENLKQRSVFSISSLNEYALTKIFSENEKKFIDFHRKFFSRVYPSGTRINSSNYDPLVPLLSGCQLIALNVQTNDLFLSIYNSFFEENGGINCGYVLKPKFLLHDFKEKQGKPAYPSQMNEIKRKVSLQILNGFNICQGKNDVFVEISVKGYRKDESENKVFRSDLIKNKFSNPDLNFSAEFTVRCPEICCIFFQIITKNNEKIAYSCVPLKCARKGYRTVPLKGISSVALENMFLFSFISITKVHKM